MTPQDTTYYTELEGLMQSRAFGSSIEREEEKNILQAFLKTRFWPAERKKALSLKMSETTLARLKIRSKEEDIPYQTLIGSVMKKWLDGRFTEKN